MEELWDDVPWAKIKISWQCFCSFFRCESVPSRLSVGVHIYKVRLMQWGALAKNKDLGNNLETSLAFQVQTLKLLPLCRFICIFFCDHLQLLCGFTWIFFDRVFLCACFGNILIWSQLLNEVLLVPGLDGSVVHRRWPWHGGQDVVVDRTAVFLQPISVPRVAL